MYHRTLYLGDTVMKSSGINLGRILGSHWFRDQATVETGTKFGLKKVDIRPTATKTGTKKF